MWHCISLRWPFQSFHCKNFLLCLLLFYFKFQLITSVSRAVYFGVLNVLIYYLGYTVKLLNFFSQFFPTAWTDELFILTGIMKLDLVYLLNVASLIYRVVKLDKHPTLRGDLDLWLSPNQYGTRRNDSFILPFPRTEAIRSNFNYQFIQIWNSVPMEIKKQSSLSRFKNKYKEFFFHNFDFVL